MNNQNDKKIEEIIEKTLEYIDSGKTPAEIFDLLPQYQETVKEILTVVSLLKKESELVIPSKELFRQTMDKIAGNVTNRFNPRYSYMEEVQGRPSLNNIITKINDLMTINWKIWAPLGIVAVVALVIISSYQFGTKSPQAPIAEETPQAPVAVSQELPVAVTKPATGNVDDAVNAILAGISDDEALLADAAKDAELIAADSQAISDFGQSYNENEF
jgi:tetrahydromethanopterin S-methyltransferase subunit B